MVRIAYAERLRTLFNVRGKFWFAYCLLHDFCSSAAGPVCDIADPIAEEERCGSLLLFEFER